MLCCFRSNKQWGPLGGNLHNPVVAALTLYLQQQLRLTTVRFNFAGSQIGRGYAQVEQVKAIVDHLLAGTLEPCDATAAATEPSSQSHSQQKQLQNPTNVLLIGYSYGSLIMGSALADIPQAVGGVWIAPPFGVQHWLLLFHSQYHLQRSVQRPDLPRLLILGDQDNFTSVATFEQVLDKTFPKPTTTGALLRGADHFFPRREKDVIDVLAQWLKTTFDVDDLLQLRDLSDFPTAASTT